jgi:hypothetical protein
MVLKSIVAPSTRVTVTTRSKLFVGLNTTSQWAVRPTRQPDPLCM